MLFEYFDSKFGYDIVIEQFQQNMTPFCIKTGIKWALIITLFLAYQIYIQKFCVQMHSHLDVCKDHENMISTRLDQRKST